jgi:hypothetical protein
VRLGVQTVTYRFRLLVSNLVSKPNRNPIIKGQSLQAVPLIFVKHFLAPFIHFKQNEQHDYSGIKLQQSQSSYILLRPDQSDEGVSVS